MSNLETVNISITLSSDYWNNPPKVKVYIDDTEIFNDSISDRKIISWDGLLAEGKHKLTIEMYDKNKYQTVVEGDKIIKDQILNIDEIGFDDIDIGHLKHALSNYYPNKNVYNHDVPSQITNCVNLGYNGRWELEFTTPIYMWLLENI